MELKLTNSEKFELLDISIEEFNELLKEELFIKELYVIKKEELELIQKIIGDSIELEIDTDILEDTTRASFSALDGKIFLIKRKKINIGLLFMMLDSSVNFVSGDKWTKIIAILTVFKKLFLTILDEDENILYAYLCKEYFKNGKRFSNTEIFDAVNKYLNQYFGVSWSDKKINDILLKLENLQVIDFLDGILYVKDKIYFE